MGVERLMRAVIVIVPLVVFEIVTRMGVLDPFTFIPFSDMLRAAGSMLLNPDFLMNSLAPTAMEAITSFLTASILGIAFGIVLWRSDFLYQSLQPYLLLFYALPFFAIYPVFISLFGTGPKPVVMIGMLFAMPSVISNTAIGFRETKEVLIKVGRALDLSQFQMLRKIYIPAAWPHIFTGLKLALAYSIISVIATEFILSTRGLGHSIAFAYNNFDLKGMYGAILLVIAIVVTINLILSYFEGSIYKRNVNGTHV